MIFDPEQVARRFHESYERLAPEYNYKTRDATAVPWEDVPADNRGLMIAVAQDVLSAARVMVDHENQQTIMMFVSEVRTAERRDE